MDHEQPPRQWTLPSPSPYEHRPLTKQKFRSHGALYQSYLHTEPIRPPRPTRPLPPVNPAELSPTWSPSTSTSPTTPYSSIYSSPSIRYAEMCVEEEEEEAYIDSFREASNNFYLPAFDSAIVSNPRPDSWILPNNPSNRSAATSQSNLTIAIPVDKPLRRKVSGIASNGRPDSWVLPSNPSDRSAATSQSNLTIAIPVDKPLRKKISGIVSNGHPDSWVSPNTPSDRSAATSPSNLAIAIPIDEPPPKKVPRNEPARPVSAPANPSIPPIPPSPTGRPTSDAPPPRQSRLLNLPRLRTARSKPEIKAQAEISPTTKTKITSPAVMHLTQSVAHRYSFKALKKYSGWPGYLSYKKGEVLWADDLTVFDGRIEAINKKGQTGFVALRDMMLFDQHKPSDVT